MPLRILHFSSSDLHGGAAKAAYRLHCALRTAGHASKMIVRDKLSNDPDVIQVAGRRGLRLGRKLLERLSPASQWRRQPDFNADVAPAVMLEPALSAIDGQVDVLCLHWITGLLSTRNIAMLAQRYRCPMVWMLTDQEPYTGGCHYTYECTGYRRQCGRCPQLQSSRPCDRSSLVWRRKQRWLSPLPIAFVSSCSWTTARIRESSLFGKHAVVDIGDAMDEETFRPLNQQVARDLLHVPLDARVIFFGAFSLDNPRKGMSHLVAALRQLPGLETADGKSDPFLLCAGHKPDSLIGDLPYRYRSLGYLKDDLTLALAYQAADLFVSPSIYEAGSMMIPEAMLCGTPAVAFDVGNARDLIRTGETGYLAAYRDSADLARGIATVLCRPDLSAMRQAAHKTAYSRHASAVVARQHAGLYGKLCPGKV